MLFVVIVTFVGKAPEAILTVGIDAAFSLPTIVAELTFD